MFAFSFFLLASLVSANNIPVENNVLILDDTNFDEAIAANDLLLVEFYAPWCGHCKKLAPEWDKAAATLAADEVSAKLAKVDATVATKLAERFAINGFPTINFFRGGKKLEYQGGRVANEIVSWVKKQSGPAATTLNTAAEVEAAREKTDDAIVIGYFSSAESSSAKKFLDLASQNELLQFYISSSDAVKNALTLTGDTVVILKPFDDNRNDLSVSEFDSAEVAAFVAGNSAPLVQVFSQDAAKKIFSSPVQTHTLFFTDSKADHHAPTLAAMTEVAKQFKGRTLLVNVPSSEDRVLDYFGIKKTELPTLVVVDMSNEAGMKKYPFVGTIGAEAVASHVAGVLSGDVTPTLKSEAVAPEDTLGDVVVLKGTSFNDLVLKSNKNVLVEFYAPWCGHCKKLAPTYDELGAHYRSNDKVVIAKMDSTANEIDVEGVSVKGFPTLYFFPAGQTPRKYEGGRELSDFIEYIDSFVSGGEDHDEL